MKPSIIVWDLETVPDLGGFAAANDLVGKSDAEVREAIGEKFPKHIYHSIVCIGALIAHHETDYWAVDTVGFGLYSRFCTGTNAAHKMDASGNRSRTFSLIGENESKWWSSCNRLL